MITILSLLLPQSAYFLRLYPTCPEVQKKECGKVPYNKLIYHRVN